MSSPETDVVWVRRGLGLPVSELGGHPTELPQPAAVVQGEPFGFKERYLWAMLMERVDGAVTALGLNGSRLLVAASGGIDSSVLVHALCELAPKRGLTLAVAHVQHGLRGDDSKADEQEVRRMAGQLRLPILCEPADPRPERAGRSNRARLTLQEAARRVRYAALRRMSARWGADHIVTGHNLDDQAETVLMRLLRGTGPRGIAGIARRSRSGELVRPLLDVPRSNIEQFARERQISWREDESNHGDAYTRNRLRHHWIPALRDEFNPQLLRAIGRLTEALQDDADWIDGIVTETAHRMATKRANRRGEDLIWVDSGWNELPDALALRVVRQGLHEMGSGRGVERIHLQRILAFLRKPDLETGRRIELPGGDVLVRTSTGYRLSIHRVDGQSPC